MRKPSTPFGIGIALFLLAASAALAAPPAFLAAAPGQPAGSPALAALFSPAVSSLPAQAADVGSCGPIRYFCQACNPASTGQRLCSEQICGTYVILNCRPCASECILPPA